MEDGLVALSAKFLMGVDTKQRLDVTFKVLFRPHMSLDWRV